MSFTYQGKTYSSVTAYNKSQGAGSGASSVRSTPIQTSQPSQPVVEQPRPPIQAVPTLQPNISTERGPAYASPSGQLTYLNLTQPQQTSQPNISLLRGGVGYAEPSGRIRVMEPIATSSKPAKVEEISRVTRATPTGSEEIITSRVTPAFMYRETGELIARNPPATDIEKLFTQGASKVREVGSRVGKFIEQPFGKQQFKDTSFGRVTETSSILALAGQSRGSEKVSSYFAEIPFTPISSILQTGASTTRLFTGRQTTTSEKIDVGVTAATVLIAGGVGFKAGRDIYTTNILQSTLGKSPTFLKDFAIPVAKATATSVFGSIAAYDIVTSSNPRQTSLNILGDIGKLGIVGEASYFGGKATGSYLTQPRFLTSSTGGTTTQQSLRAVGREKVGGIISENQRVFKNLLGERFREVTSTEVIFKGSETKTIGEAKINFLRAFESRGKSILVGQSVSRGSLFEALRPYQYTGAPDFTQLIRTATRQTGTKGISQADYGVTGRTYNIPIENKILSSFTDQTTFETSPSVVKTVSDVSGYSKIYKLPSYTKIKSLPPLSKSLFTGKELVQSLDISFAPSQYQTTNTFRGLTYSVSNLLSGITSQRTSLDVFDTRDIVKRFNLFPQGRRGAVSIGRTPSGIETGFEVLERPGTGIKPRLEFKEVPKVFNPTDISTITNAPSLLVTSVRAIPSFTGFAIPGGIASNFPNIQSLQAIRSIPSSQLLTQAFSTNIAGTAPQTNVGFLGLTTPLSGVITKGITTTAPQTIIQPIPGITITPGFTDTFFTPPPLIFPFGGVSYPLEFPGRRGTPSSFGKLFSGYTPNLRGVAQGRIERLSQTRLGSIRYSGAEIRGISTDVARALGMRKPRRRKRR